MMLVFTGCATQKGVDPFLALTPEQVAAIVVTASQKDFSATNRSLLEQEFVIRDTNTVQRIAVLLRDSPRIDTYLPGIGWLAHLEFRNKSGGPLAYASIINYGSRIAFSGPRSSDEDFQVTYSKEVCRIIYDLMLVNCPEIIARKQRVYQRVGKTLEGLLFGEADKEDAQPKPDGHGPKPAP